MQAGKQSGEARESENSSQDTSMAHLKQRMVYTPLLPFRVCFSGNLPMIFYSSVLLWLPQD